MIDEKALEAAIERYPVALQEACDAGKVASHRMKFAVRAAILAYEAAKAQTLALLVTPDRGRRVEHPMAAKPASEPVAGCLLKAIETLPDDFTDDGNCCAGRLSAPASKDGPDALRPD